ncbi:hypothetical protein DFH07DRAFT_954688 [Mycena maculata]|uniref:Uncharacterized protein n=1 Tax=Mycena maculata TaxID=230809 RepID=A0AAD7NN48_9AGAR|nr:hypothetical protein DFH07DRAFT_954688 [Mycena maculata]
MLIPSDTMRTSHRPPPGSRASLSHPAQRHSKASTARDTGESPPSHTRPVSAVRDSPVLHSSDDSVRAPHLHHGTRAQGLSARTTTLLDSAVRTPTSTPALRPWRQAFLCRLDLHSPRPPFIRRAAHTLIDCATVPRYPGGSACSLSSGACVPFSSRLRTSEHARPQRPSSMLTLSARKSVSCGPAPASLHLSTSVHAGLSVSALLASEWPDADDASDCPEKLDCDCDDDDEVACACMGCSRVDFGLVERAVGGDANTEPAREELVDKHPAEGERCQRQYKDEGRNERRRKEDSGSTTATALDPNRIPISFPAALPASAMRGPPNGMSRSHERSHTCAAYVA